VCGGVREGWVGATGKCEVDVGGCGARGEESGEISVGVGVERGGKGADMRPCGKLYLAVVFAIVSSATTKFALV
jgi:hypothetical protein